MLFIPLYNILLIKNESFQFIKFTVKDPTPNAHLVNGLNREIFCDVVEYNLLPPVRIPFCNLARAPSLADDETLARVELATLRTIFSSSLLFIVKV
jgi:hypothetical protein